MCSTRICYHSGLGLKKRSAEGGGVGEDQAYVPRTCQISPSPVILRICSSPFRLP